MALMRFDLAGLAWTALDGRRPACMSFEGLDGAGKKVMA
jgi:hypothetical protein